MLEGALVGLIWLLVYALCVAVICWIVTKILATFAPPASGYAWIVWAIGGLVLLILAIRLLSNVIPSPP